MTSIADPLAALAGLSAAIDEVFAIDAPALSPDLLLEATRLIERARRRIEAVDHTLVAEIESRNLAGQHVMRSTAAFISSLLNLSPAEARSRVVRARDLGARVTLTGQPLPPALPSTAAARASGSITAQHADVISRTLGRLRPRVPVEVAQRGESFLVEQAQTLNAQVLQSVALRLVETLDPDGVLADEREQHRRRRLTLTPTGDGMTSIRGELDAQTAALAMAVLHSLGAPRQARGGGDGGGGDGGRDGAGELVRDERTGGQRLHDALRSVLKLALRAGELPTSGGVPATVLITMTAGQFERGTGWAQTSFGQRIKVDHALLLADQACVGWVVHGSTGAVLDFGRRNRIATESQTLALIARDRGCAFPGCTDPPEWTERHHVVPWRHGGRTELGNLCLLCDFHHDRIDSGGWRVTMRDSVPWFIPPAWADPEQKAVRNVRP